MPNEDESATSQDQQYSASVQELARIAHDMNDIVGSMVGLAATGIRNPRPPPPPKHWELLVKIIGNAEVIKECGLQIMTRPSSPR